MVWELAFSREAKHKRNPGWVSGKCPWYAYTKVGFVIIRFQLFFAVFLPVLTTLNISSSAIPLTLGSGTENFAAFSALLFLIAPR